MELWVHSRRKAGLPALPQKYDHFYLADETMMKHFDQFRDQVNMPPGEVLLQPNHLLRVWMKAEGVPAKVVSFGGNDYLAFPGMRMDDLCEWILKTRNDDCCNLP